MQAQVPLNNLLDYINSFSLSYSNKQWLGERLIEEARKERNNMAKQTERYKLFKQLAGVWENDPSMDTIEETIAEGRKADYEREILPLND